MYWSIPIEKSPTSLKATRLVSRNATPMAMARPIDQNRVKSPMSTHTPPTSSVIAAIHASGTWYDQPWRSSSRAMRKSPLARTGSPVPLPASGAARAVGGAGSSLVGRGEAGGAACDWFGDTASAGCSAASDARANPGSASAEATTFISRSRFASSPEYSTSCMSLFQPMGTNARQRTIRASSGTRLREADWLRLMGRPEGRPDGEVREASTL